LVPSAKKLFVNIKDSHRNKLQKVNLAFLSKLFTLIYSIIVLFNIKALMKKYLADCFIHVDIKVSRPQYR
jgi:hypothetical protein